MTIVQLRANHNRCGEVEPAIRPDEVQFFSVYLGNPGAFKLMAPSSARALRLRTPPRWLFSTTQPSNAPSSTPF